MITEEPTVRLRDGRTVLCALADWVDDLLAAGCEIDVTEEGAVRCWPPCHADLQYHFDCSPDDVAAILQDRRAPVSVH